MRKWRVKSSQKIIRLLCIFRGRFFKIVVDWCFYRLHAFFLKKYFSEHYRRAVPVNTGHKLNVLCAFNLRPVSTGVAVYQINKNLHQSHKKKKMLQKLWKLSGTLPRTGLQRNTNLASAESLKHFSCKYNW